MPNWVEPPLPLAIALIIRSTSTPGLEPERHRLRGRGDIDGDEEVVDELHFARGAERPEIEAEIGEALDHRLELLAGLGVAAEVDDGLARRHHAGRAADLAVDVRHAFAGERRHVLLLVRNRMGAELDDDLARPGGLDQALRAANDRVHRLGRRQAAEHHVGLRADLGGRFRRHAAELLELRERAAAIAEHAISALDQVLRDREPDLADTDEADRFHAHVLPRITQLRATDRRSSRGCRASPPSPSIRAPRRYASRR